MSGLDDGRWIGSQFCRRRAGLRGILAGDGYEIVRISGDRIPKPSVGLMAKGYERDKGDGEGCKEM